MKKTLLLFIFVSLVYNINGQNNYQKKLGSFYSNYKPATLILYNGDTLKGIAKINLMPDKVFFKKNEDDKKTKFTHKNLEKITFSLSGNIKKIFEFKQIIVRPGTEYMAIYNKLLEPISDGKTKVYHRTEYKTLNNSWTAEHKYYYENFDERSVNRITSLKKLSKTLFKYCPKMMDEIKNKKFEGKSYKHIFNYYNNNCNN